MFSFFGGGLGATPGCDGLSHGNNPISMATIPPVEILEASYPVMFTQWALRPDSAGAGRIAAASARSMRSRCWRRAAPTCSCSASAASFAPFGVDGGGAAALNRFVYDTPEGKQTPPLVSKVVDVKIAKGQRVRLETPGGGGYGPPTRARPRGDRARRAARLCQPGEAEGDASSDRLDAGRRRCVSRDLRSASTSAAPSPICSCSTARPGRFETAKTPSQRGDEARGFLAGLDALGRVADFHAIVHGTTVGTNALLERKGAKVGLITTPGFRDVLEMRRRDRPRTWGLSGDFTPDRRPRPQRRSGRAHAGRRDACAWPSTPQEIAAQRARTRCARGAEALAIVFINAYANPANERAAAAAARAVWPNAHVIASSEILPEIREFERASTTALNAYLQPVVGNYLDRLQGALKARDFARRVPYRAIERRRHVGARARANSPCARRCPVPRRA